MWSLEVLASLSPASEQESSSGVEEGGLGAEPHGLDGRHRMGVKHSRK